MTHKTLWNTKTGESAVFALDVDVSNWPDFQETKPAATATQARSERDSLLSETDTWALSDRTMTAEQTAYRQALRDITGQAGFPDNITWPTKP